MTTATRAVTAPAAGTTADTLSVDFDTRLTLASIAIDVALSNHDIQEAHDAVAEAELHVAAPQPVGHPVLKAAGDIIRARGWIQGQMMDERGAVCTMGAIQIAASLTGTDVADASLVLINRIDASIPLWNDRPGRTEDEVLSVLW